MAFTITDIEKSNTEMRIFTGAENQEYDFDKAMLRSFEIGRETTSLVFFRESDDPFY